MIPTSEHLVSMTVNGVPRQAMAEARMSLADWLRETQNLTGTHIGCEHGVCGACTVLVNGLPVRSCLMLAVQAEGAEVLTIEGIAQDGQLHPVQQAFQEEHALQCGFCTPGFLTTVLRFLYDHPSPTEDEIREALSGNLCRCTGYTNIVRAVKRAASLLAAQPGWGAAYFVHDEAMGGGA